MTMHDASGFVRCLTWDGLQVPQDQAMHPYDSVLARFSFESARNDNTTARTVNWQGPF